MRSMLKKMPLPISGLMLGLAALGNLMQSYGNDFRNLCGVLAMAIFVLLLAKIILYTKGVAEALENPVVASVSPTFSMGMMLLATYIKPYITSLASFFWMGGFILHLALICWFSKKFLFKEYKIQKVFPSWFIPYVGIAVASVTAGAFGLPLLGKLSFYFALAAFVLLLPVVFKRVFVVKEIPEAALPTLAIITAPASLCLAGYMNAFENKNLLMVYGLLIFSQALYAGVLLYLPKIIRLPFYPSYSGLTFPLVISGISLKLVHGFLAQTGNIPVFLPALVKFEEGAAVLACLYVLVCYASFLAPKRETGLSQAK